jgi:hypothetical protein
MYIRRYEVWSWSKRINDLKGGAVMHLFTFNVQYSKSVKDFLHKVILMVWSEAN